MQCKPVAAFHDNATRIARRGRFACGGNAFQLTQNRKLAAQGRRSAVIRCRLHGDRDKRGNHLAQQLRHQFAVDIREAEVAALEAVDQLGVIEAEQVQDRGVQVVDVDGFFDCVEAELIAPAQ